jgi:hypothetical protein
MVKSLPSTRGSLPFPLVGVPFELTSATFARLIMEQVPGCFATSTIPESEQGSSLTPTDKAHFIARQHQALVSEPTRAWC